MLSIPSKIVESVACNSLDKHLESSIHKNQWAYKKGLSIESLLLYLTEQWKGHIDQGDIVGVLMIDFRKAFDSIDHSILFRKMKEIGMGGKMLAWMKNYTEDRTQFVEINHKRSPVRNINYGIPQGSMFGPTLFSIFVNDLPTCNTTGEINMYADDTTAHLVGNSIDEVILKLNDVAEQIHSWCIKNKLTVHTKKSKVMILQQRRLIGPLLPVKMGQNCLEYVNSEKVLGINIDEKLSWKEHTDKVVKSMSSKICMLKRLKYLPSNMLEEIYYKTVIPAATYCISVWGSCLEPTFKRVEKQHIRAANVIYRLNKSIKDEDVLAAVNWQDLGYIYKRKIAIEMHKVTFDTKSRIAHQYCVGRQSLRKGAKFEIKRMRTELGRQSIQFRGPIIWNSLNKELKKQTIRETFERHLRSDMKTLNKLSFGQETTFNANRDENHVYY